MSRSSGRYVPVSVPVPMTVPRGYYYTDDNVPDYTESETNLSYPQWLEQQSQNTEREQNTNPTANVSSAQWSPVTQQPTAGAPVESNNRERHHMQRHENMVPNPSPDITEIFRRKQEDRYIMSPEVMVTDESPRFYYRTAPTLTRVPQRRIPVERDRAHMSVTPISPSQVLHHPIGYYSADEHVVPAHTYETLVFHSTPHLHRPITPKGGMPPPHLIAESTGQINTQRSIRPPFKPAVSVRTPRYIRRAGLIKRPSALCLPLNCEQDLATHRQIKSRLPSTMPGIQVISPRQRTQIRQIQQHSISSSRDESPNTPRSAPASYFETNNFLNRPNLVKKGKLEPGELERLQQLIQQTDMKDNREESIPDDEVLNIDELDVKRSDMEFLLDRYQQMFSNDGFACKTKISKSNIKPRTKTKNNSIKLNIGHLIKPKLPPSLKQKRGNKASAKNEEKNQKEKDKIEIERITSSVLDTLLHDLQSSGVINSEKDVVATGDGKTSQARPSSRQVSRPSSSRNDSKNSPANNNCSSLKKISDNSDSSSKSNISNSQQKNISNENSKHFSMDNTSSVEQVSEKLEDISITNYQDDEKIPKPEGTQYISNNTEVQNVTLNNPTNSLESTNDNYQIQENKNKCDSGRSTPRKSAYSKKVSMKYGNDDHAAMELHRSKSYIVNLIDRALSRELGTIPEERTSKEYLSLEARTALDLMSSPAVKNMDNDMCLEITQVLADSLSTAPIKESVPSTSNTHTSCSTPKPDCSRATDSAKVDGDLMFTTGNDEPMYIKQLKKLRWGHLKHIQREMRRLEDLERFLDSCSSEK